MDSKIKELLTVIESAKSALSLSEIKDLLQPPLPSDRTLQRRLNKLSEQKLILKTGFKKGVKYEALSLQKEHQLAVFSPESLKILDQVRKPMNQKHPVGYDSLWLESYIPNKTRYLSETEQKQLHSIGKRLKDGLPASTYAHKIYDRLLIDLSYNSSRLEGNTYSLIETKKLLLDGTPADGKLDEERTMIINHKEAIRYIVKHAAQEKISIEMLLTIHYLLSDGLIDPSYSGRLRETGVRISGTSYIPSEVPTFLKKQLKSIVNKVNLIEDPFEASIFLLAHLSYLQGFLDVNKRTARIAANIPLLKTNLVPLSFNGVDTQDYIDAVIAIYEFNTITPLIDLYKYSYLQSTKEFDVTAHAIGFDIIRVQYRSERRNLLTDVILNKLTKMKAKSYIKQRIPKSIKNQDIDLFIKSVEEDLKLMTLSRIAGLGVTPKDLYEWKRLYH